MPCRDGTLEVPTPDKAKALFMLMDRDNSQTISQDEASSAAQQMLKCLGALVKVGFDALMKGMLTPVIEYICTALVEHLDADGSGDVSIAELSGFISTCVGEAEVPAITKELARFVKMGQSKLSRNTRLDIQQLRAENKLYQAAIKEATELAAKEGVEGVTQEEFVSMSTDLTQQMIDITFKMLPPFPESILSERLKCLRPKIQDTMTQTQLQLKEDGIVKQVSSVYFELIDSDGSGRMSTEEFAVAVKLTDPEVVHSLGQAQVAK